MQEEKAPVAAVDGIDTTKLYLDHKSLEDRASYFPDDMREDVIWLGGYVRDKCNRSVDLLSRQAAKLGFATTGSTVSKILRARWNRDAEGEAIAPVMAKKAFTQMVQALRRHEQISSMAGAIPFVETRTWADIKNYIDGRRAPDAVCKFGLIIGTTGAQKSACLKQYCIRNNHGACVHIESPHTPAMGEFISDLAQAYGFSPDSNKARKMRQISEVVSELRTIIVDNIQRLFKPNQGWTQPIFNYLQKLQDDTNCTVILSCYPEFQETIRSGTGKGYFEQFVGRCGGEDEFLILDEFAPPEDVIDIAEAFGLEEANKHSRLLLALSRRPGRIRVLFKKLQKAKRLAGNKKLTIEHVKIAANIRDEKEEA